MFSRHSTPHAPNFFSRSKTRIYLPTESPALESVRPTNSLSHTGPALPAVHLSYTASSQLLSTAAVASELTTSTLVTVGYKAAGTPQGIANSTPPTDLPTLYHKPPYPPHAIQSPTIHSPVPLPTRPAAAPPHLPRPSSCHTSDPTKGHVNKCVVHTPWLIVPSTRSQHVHTMLPSTDPIHQSHPPHKPLFHRDQLIVLRCDSPNGGLAPQPAPI